MKILRSYILKECILPFFISLGVLTGIFLLGNLIQLANKVINKGVSLASVGKIFLLYVPVLLDYTLPISCLMAIILTFSRLSADNEILAIRASGIKLQKILSFLVVIGVIMSLFNILLNDRIIPFANQEQKKALKEVGIKNPTAFLEAGTFINAFQGQILFIYKIEDNRFYNIRIYQPQPDGKPTRTIIAREGEFTQVPGEDKIKLKLINGTSDEPNLKNPTNFYKLNFRNYFMTLDLSKDDKEAEKKPKSMTLKEIKAKIIEMQSLSVDVAPLKTEYHRKISRSFACLIFVLLGFPMAVITHRREKAANFFLAILCAAFYYLLSLGCEAVSIQDKLPAMVSMWIPNLVTGVAAVILNFRLCAS